MLSGGSAVRVRVFIIGMRSSFFSQGAGTRSSIALFNIYILKRKSFATILHPFFLQYGPCEDILITYLMFLHNELRFAVNRVLIMLFILTL